MSHPEGLRVVSELALRMASKKVGWIAITTLLFTIIPAVCSSIDGVGDPLEAICRYCLCDPHRRSVSCTSTHKNILLRVVSLPAWAESLHIINLSTLVEMPHFTYHPTLEVLQIDNCVKLERLSLLALVSLPNLRTLRLTNNRIDAIPEGFLHPLRRLEVLNLAGNQLSNLSDSDLSLHDDGAVLEEFVLSGNPLQVAYRDVFLPSTRQLHMDNCGIERLKVNSIVFAASSKSCNGGDECRTVKIRPGFWERLESLDLSHNSLMRIESELLPHLSNLSTLKLAHTTVSGDLLSWISSRSTRLRHLDVSHSRILAFDSSAILPAQFHFIAESINYSQPTARWNYCGGELEWLDISDISAQALVLPPTCTNLKWLYAADNSLSALDFGGGNSAGQLRTLDLRNNQLSEWPFPPEVRTTELENLSLANNSITAVPHDAVSHLGSRLESLDLSSNRLSALVISVPDGGESRLRYVNISVNRHLRKVSVGGELPALAVLDMCGNQLEEVDSTLLTMAPNLRSLHLSNNNGINVAGLVDKAGVLEELDLSRTSLRMVPDLSGLNRLRVLDLSRNRLDTINGMLLPTSLRELHLAHNRIRRLDNFSRQQWDSLEELRVEMNPVECDCSLLPLAKRFKEGSDPYFCFTVDNWEVTLSTYFNEMANCEEDSSDGAKVSVGPLALLMMFICGSIVISLVMLRICQHYLHLSTQPYHSLPQADGMPVDV